MIPSKHENTCPLDHTTYEKFIGCDCNFGSAIEVWYFKEQKLKELKAQLDVAEAVLSVQVTKSALTYFEDKTKTFRQ